ncbi:sensor domain-containing phosphodiesterase [Pseudoxanthomonas sp. JBR18]|uniref:sensor domain-containing phosphodiesterase n=1 Tax=Pseudoxanthomonas sp. JBR18 TaxID=2969308 RepID=UPI0023063707|nr:sensor domain-containing phosphodiesterase [Pseudoxanthomonas sp. JBR18]WCE06251.1 sensor domain-containing phosphodiesterase [Pseudoxanthomonas sp. JBR18]
MPTKEAERLALIRSLNVLGLEDAPSLTRITKLVSQLFDVPTVLISIVGEHDQHFLGRHGFSVNQTERSVSVCAHAIEQRGVFEVCDLTVDSRFSRNRLVVEEPRLRFYAGAPLVTSHGIAIGTLCLIDYKPRRLTGVQHEQLEAFAAMVVDQIALLSSVGRRDAVSGYPNRQQFSIDLRAQVDAAPESEFQLALADIFDIHSAHRLGQTLGMRPVESIIRQVGSRIAAQLPHQSLLYHVGVTRYAFLLIDQDAQATAALLEAVRDVATLPVHVDGLVLQPMCHGGLATFHAEGAPDALRRAIVAMHEAVETRRPWVRYTASRDERLQREYKIAGGICSAMRNNELYLLYQPRLALPSGEMTGVEALLRWNHPELGQLSPGEFIPVLERTAAMPAVTDWVLQAAMEQCRAWGARLADATISVNFSASDFQDGRVPERVLAALGRSGIAADRLEVEVTEGLWLENLPAAAAQMEALREMGVRISIDDFGAGYSNFAYLHSLPIDTIKLDRSLISGFERSTIRRGVVRTIISLCHQLNWRVVAEGVEQLAEAELLATCGCDEIQGYYFSVPLDADQLMRGPLPHDAMPAITSLAS